MILGKLWNAFAAQVNKLANFFWTSDPIAQLQYEYDKAVDQMKDGREGLEQYRALVERVARQVNNDRQHVASNWVGAVVVPELRMVRDPTAPRLEPFLLRRGLQWLRSTWLLRTSDSTCKHRVSPLSATTTPSSPTPSMKASIIEKVVVLVS